MDLSDIFFYIHWQAKIFHYGSISLITEPCKSAHIAAAKAAKDAGVVISYDPNLRLPLWRCADSAREGILSIWDTADIIKVAMLIIFFSSSQVMFFVPHFLKIYMKLKIEKQPSPTVKLN